GEKQSFESIPPSPHKKKASANRELSLLLANVSVKRWNVAGVDALPTLMSHQGCFACLARPCNQNNWRVGQRFSNAHFNQARVERRLIHKHLEP
ncbi:hypothetical protein, partial [Chlorobium sp. KB01]|uniref:hypothetical protein n=1 Tax=Chlorobium sp. KB01 TaxID=1917528 RepID=UPI001E5439F7